MDNINNSNQIDELLIQVTPPLKGRRTKEGTPKKSKPTLGKLMRQCKAIIAPAQLLYSGKVATMQPYPSNSEQDVLVLQAFLDSYEQNAVGNEDKALDEETGEFELVRQVPESNNLLRQYSQPFLDCSSCCTHSRPHQRQSARACQVCLWLFIPK